MSITVRLIVCCVLTAGGFGLFRERQPDRAHVEWLRQRYAEATTVAAGMTRADLMKRFEVDGGLQPLLPTRYVLKGSGMIKVDVEFDAPDAVKAKIVPEEFESAVPVGTPRRTAAQLGYQVVPDTQLKIKSISRPYLEPFTLD